VTTTRSLEPEDLKSSIPPKIILYISINIWFITPYDQGILWKIKVKDTEMKNVLQSKLMNALKKSKYDCVLLYMIELTYFISCEI
jgi:hypothetical protein